MSEEHEARLIGTPIQKKLHEARRER